MWIRHIMPYLFSSYKTRSRSCRLYDSRQSIITCIATGAVWSYHSNVWFLVVQYQSKCIFVYWYVQQSSRHTIFFNSTIDRDKNVRRTMLFGNIVWMLLWVLMQYKTHALHWWWTWNLLGIYFLTILIALWIYGWHCSLNRLIFCIDYFSLYNYPQALPYTWLFCNIEGRA